MFQLILIIVSSANNITVGTIGFEMQSYTAQEESRSAEVCLAILDPTDVSNISPLALAFFFVETVVGTATGKILLLSMIIKKFVSVLVGVHIVCVQN